MIAVCLIRADPHYRRQAFEDGLRRAGYTLRNTIDLTPEPADFLVIWNRYGPYAEYARQWEAAGGTVLVCENGYFGCDASGRQHYAIAIHGHNGSGFWPAGDGRRLAALGIVFNAWRSHGTHIVICLQRGIGAPEMAQPGDWQSRVTAQLSGWPVILRRHPARHAPERSLSDDLTNAWAMVTWASNAATQSLIEGVPVFYCGPHIVTAGAAIQGLAQLATPPLPDRIPAFERLAWAQWSVQEIESGEAFAYLRDLARQQPDRLRSVC